MTQRATFRKDIQVLRGIAVLLVLFFHAQLGGLEAGYLGVDIFFVVSGYLITGLVHRRLAEGRFSFSGFYVDRAKRLLPVAYVVYAGTAIAAYWFLTNSEFERLLTTLWGALTFTANIALWTGTDYFSPGAKFNALLHVWSLSIEEQFYFLLPLVLFMTPPRYRLTLVVVGGAGSLALCLYLVSKSPVASFYLLPTRAWELAIGAALALAEARRQERGLNGDAPSLPRSAFGLGALAVALLIPVFAPGASLLGSPHPGVDAILVCLATAVLLTVRLCYLEQGPIAWGLARIGDISYSLYLVHWPLFAFATNVYVGESPPLEVRIGLVLISVVLAWLLFHHVEEPLRRRSFGDVRLRPALTAVAASLAVACLAVGVGQVRRMTQTTEFTPRSANFGFHENCEFVDQFVPLYECASAAAPDTLIWGDSFAMHLVPGLAAIHPSGIWQATKSLCGPVRDVAPAWPTIPYSREWSVDCIDFNSSVERFLLGRTEIQRVVLSSPFTQYTSDQAAALISDGSYVVLRKPNARMDFIEQFSNSIRRIQSLGKEVVIVSPTPAAGFDIGLCFERRLVGLVTFGPNRDCQLQAEAARRFREEVNSVLREVAAATGARLVNLADYLCDETVCRTEIDSVPLYWDGGHLSAAGSVKVMTATGAGSAILGRSSGASLNANSD